MRDSFAIVTRTFVVAALCISAVSCTQAGGGTPAEPDASTPKPPDATTTPPPTGSGITGRWIGTFTTDNALASAGSFTFDLTEDASTHAVKGPFTGMVTAGAAGTAFQGTFDGMKAVTTLNGNVAIVQPAGVTGDFGFHDAAITGVGDGNKIAGMFNINISYAGLPVMAMGSYTINR